MDTNETDDAEIEALIAELQPHVIKRTGLGARKTKWCGHDGNIGMMEGQPEKVELWADMLIDALRDTHDRKKRSIAIAKNFLGKS